MADSLMQAARHIAETEDRYFGNNDEMKILAQNTARYMINEINLNAIKTKNQTIFFKLEYLFFGFFLGAFPVSLLWISYLLRWIK